MITQEGSDFQMKRLLKPYIYAQTNEQEGLKETRFLLTKS
jgi:hypothetical protein